MRAALFALALALAVWPLATRADDYGPKRDVAAIRHDLPIIERGHEIYDGVLRGITIDSVVVDGPIALGQFHEGQITSIVKLVYKLDRWWLDEDLIYDFLEASCLPAYLPTPDLLSYHVPRSLVELATNHMPAVEEAVSTTRRYAEDKAHTHCYQGADLVDPAYWPQVLPFGSLFRRRIEGDGIYQVTIKLAPNDGDKDAEIDGIGSRAPTQAESWANPPSGNSYFFFSGTVRSTKIVHVNGGTALDVWFPFVLDPSLRYSLTIGGHGFTPLGPVDGTLKDNTLHFVLPAFVAPPGVDLMGEIDSD